MNTQTILTIFTNLETSLATEALTGKNYRGIQKALSAAKKQQLTTVKCNGKKQLLLTEAKRILAMKTNKTNEVTPAIPAPELIGSKLIDILADNDYRLGIEGLKKFDEHLYSFNLSMWFGHSLTIDITGEFYTPEGERFNIELNSKAQPCVLYMTKGKQTFNTGDAATFPKEWDQHLIYIQKAVQDIQGGRVIIKKPLRIKKAA